jgi:hypothetical protein
MNTETTTPDWEAWSKEAVQLMLERNAQWPQQFHLSTPLQHQWDLDAATLLLDDGQRKVLATVCLVGSSSKEEGSFVWSWANPAIPTQHALALEVVHDFGRNNQLALLTTPRIQGGLPEAMECLCIAGRLQHAIGTFIDRQGDISLYFTILHLQAISPIN